MSYLRVLIVEDDEPFRRALCLLLRERVEVQVFEASDGLEAVEKAKALQPDLVMLDISLPKLNGIESAKKVRALVPHATLLFVSQESSPDVVRETFLVGARGYVHKLQVVTDLFSAIEAVLRGNRFLSKGLEFSDGPYAQLRNTELVQSANISDLQKMEEARFFDPVFVNDATILKDLDGIISAWSPAACRMFGYTEKEVVGRSITIIIPPELRGEESDILGQLRDGQRIENYRTRRVSKDGRTIDVSLTISPVIDAEGRIVGACKSVRDITIRAK